MNGGKQRRNETTAAPIRGKNRLYESIVKLVVREWKVIRLEKDQILIKQLFKHIIPYYLPPHIPTFKISLNENSDYSKEKLEKFAGE